MSYLNELPDERWLHNVATNWKKAPRPSFETIRHCLVGEVEGIGTVEWKDPYFHITLLGTPKSLRYDTCTFVMNADGCKVREIYVLLEDKRVLVKSATQDNVTLRIAEALSRMFYGIQGYQDHQFES